MDEWGPPKFKTGHVMYPCPLSGMVCCLQSGTRYDQPVCQIWRLYIYLLRRYEKRWKMQKLGWSGAKGPWRSSAM